MLRRAMKRWKTLPCGWVKICYVNKHRQAMYAIFYEETVPEGWSLQKWRRKIRKLVEYQSRELKNASVAMGTLALGTKSGLAAS